MNRKSAMEKAMELLTKMYKEESDDICILEDGIKDIDQGWIIPYDSRQYCETQDSMHGMIGNVPIFVSRGSGRAYVMHLLGKTPENWIAECLANE